MSVTNYRSQIPLQAGADLSGADAKFRAVTIGGTIYTGAAGAGAAIAGVNVDSARSGEWIGVVFAGFQKVRISGTVSTPGFPLAIGSGGAFLAAASGQTYCARYWEQTAASTGDLATVLLSIDNPAAFAGV